MIYHALRVSDAYFQKLSVLRNERSSHTLISSITGLSYLHAINAETQSLHLVDPDRDQIDYNRVIIKILQNTPSLEEFIAIITGHSVRHAKSGWKLIEPIEQGRKAWEALQDIELYFFFMNTIGRMRVYPNLYCGTLTDQTILFKGWNLQTMHFSWRFFEGAFKDDASFNELQQTIRTIPISFFEGKLEEFPFEETGGQFPLRALISNGDSPLFSSNDSIFRTIARKSSVATRYISWHRDTMVYPDNETRQWLASLLKPKLAHSVVSLGGSLKGLADGTTVAETIYDSPSELQASKPFGLPLLFINLDPKQCSELFFKELHAAAVPGFARILCSGEGKGTATAALIETAGFLESYALTHLEQNHSKFFLELSLKQTISA